MAVHRAGTGGRSLFAGQRQCRRPAAYPAAAGSRVRRVARNDPDSPGDARLPGIPAAGAVRGGGAAGRGVPLPRLGGRCAWPLYRGRLRGAGRFERPPGHRAVLPEPRLPPRARAVAGTRGARSEEHTSELQSLMRISNAVFCLTKKNATNTSFATPTVVVNALLAAIPAQNYPNLRKKQD